MSSDSVIKVEGLSKSYRNGWRRTSRIDALREVSFEVRPGEIFGLLGPNGAGKTTFVKILLGIVRKSSGTARLLGHLAGSRKARREIGYMPEHLQFAPHHTANSALEFYGGLSGVSASRVRRCRDELLSKVGLEEWRRVPVRKFSKGMMQRLGLAQALLHEPRLLILDEPTDGLDPIWRSAVRNILAELRDQGNTVFVNSHLLQEVEMVCDRVAILDQGKLKYVGSIDAVTDEISSVSYGRLELELLGSRSTIEVALAEVSVETWNPLDENRITVLINLPDQNDIDACVDRLRSHGISIVRLTRTRASLEDAFLSILAETPEHAEAASPGNNLPAEKDE